MTPMPILKSYSGLILSLSVACACSSASPRPEVAPSRFEVFVEEGDTTRPVAPGETLHTGERLVISISTPRLLHVSLLQSSSDGTAAALSEPGTESPRAGTLRIPSQGAFVLDESTGAETLTVVLSERALEDADPELRAAIDAAQAGEAGPVQALRPRGRAELRGAAVDLYPDASGVAIYHFGFDHATAGASGPAPPTRGIVGEDGIISEDGATGPSPEER